MLSNSLTWLGVNLVFYQWYKKTIFVATLIIWFQDHLAMDQWIKSDTMC